MKEITIAILLGLFFCKVGFAQKAVTPFSSFNSIGVAVGQAFPDLVLETVNGVEFSKWYSGIGVGMDNYEYKSLPLFIDGKYYFGNENKNGGFIFGDIGYNIPMRNIPGKEITYYDSYHFTGGVYTSFGVGCQVPLDKKVSILFSLGYGYKELGTVVGVNVCPFAGPCYVAYSNYKFGINRIILKTGLRF